MKIEKTKGPKYDPFFTLIPFLFGFELLQRKSCWAPRHTHTPKLTTFHLNVIYRPKSKTINIYSFCFINVCTLAQINWFCYYFMHVIVHHIIFKLSLMLNYFRYFNQRP